MISTCQKFNASEFWKCQKNSKSESYIEKIYKKNHVKQSGNLKVGFHKNKGCHYLPKCLIDMQIFSVQYGLSKGLVLISNMKDCGTAEPDFLKIVQQYKVNVGFFCWKKYQISWKRYKMYFVEQCILTLYKWPLCILGSVSRGSFTKKCNGFRFEHWKRIFYCTRFIHWKKELNLNFLLINEFHFWLL